MKTRLHDGTGERVYRYVLEHRDRHGNVQIYLRRKGQPYIRLRAKPGTPEFDAEYQAAFSHGKTAAATTGAAPASGSIAWLCQRYFISPSFMQLNETTRKARRSILENMLPRAGALPYRLMEPRDVAKLRDEKQATPEAANGRVKALRQLFKWACLPEYAYATRNPAREVGYLASRNPDGFRAWTNADATAFETQWPIGSKPRLAFDLLLYTGVRASDVIKLGPQMERDGALVFSETKGARRIVKTHSLPILAPLRASIDAAPAGHLIYLVTEWGKPYSSVTSFGNWFRRQCRAAGLSGLSPHGVRKLAAVRCAEAGATDQQMMALFGWTTPKQSAHYTRSANRAKLERDAAPLLVRTENENESRPFRNESPV